MYFIGKSYRGRNIAVWRLCIHIFFDSVRKQSTSLLYSKGTAVEPHSSCFPLLGLGLGQWFGRSCTLLQTVDGNFSQISLHGQINPRFILVNIINAAPEGVLHVSIHIMARRKKLSRFSNKIELLFRGRFLVRVFRMGTVVFQSRGIHHGGATLCQRGTNIKLVQSQILVQTFFYLQLTSFGLEARNGILECGQSWLKCLKTWRAVDFTLISQQTASSSSFLVSIPSPEARLTPINEKNGAASPPNIDLLVFSRSSA